jgi:eukaryotic-like serine/threonine-protein kinase
MIGTELGSYRILSKIGEGGMGVVYIGEHKLLGRKAAIKVLLAELSTNREVVMRFFNEAKATTQINHPGIVSIFDFGQAADSSAYIIMELLEGESLSARSQRLGKLPLETAATIARQMASALAAAHAVGVVHRDLKPDNVYMVPDPEVPGSDRVKILDFGIAKLVASSGIPASKTRTGSVMGTPTYMSPEQCRGTGIDHRTDIYALGCVFFQLLCGRPPFDAVGIGELFGLHLFTPPPAPSSLDASIPPAVDAIVMKMLAKGVDERYQKMEEVVAAIDDAVPEAAPVRARRSENSQVVKLPTARDTVVDEEEKAAVESAATIPPEDALKQIEAKAEAAAKAKAAPRPEPVTEAAPLPPPPGKSNTTLRGAAGEAEAAPEAPRRRQPWGLFAAAAAVFAVSGVATWYVTSGHKSTPAAATAPAKVTLTIDSDPSGAEVFRGADGIRVGVTPYKMIVAPVEGEAVFLIKKAGFVDAQVSIPADRDGDRKVTLVPRQ